MFSTSICGCFTPLNTLFLIHSVLLQLSSETTSLAWHVAWKKSLDNYKCTLTQRAKHFLCYLFVFDRIWRSRGRPNRQEFPSVLGSDNRCHVMWLSSRRSRFAAAALSNVPTIRPAPPLTPAVQLWHRTVSDLEIPWREEGSGNNDYVFVHVCVREAEKTLKFLICFWREM